MKSNRLQVLFLILICIVGLETKAESLTCEVNEFFNSQSEKQNFTLQSTTDSHGGWYTLANRHFTEVTGFVSLLKKDDQYFAVMSLYSDALKINSSGQYQMVLDGQYAQHQLIIPSQNTTLDGISIVCNFTKAK